MHSHLATCTATVTLPSKLRNTGASLSLCVVKQIIKKKENHISYLLEANNESALADTNMWTVRRVPSTSQTCPVLLFESLFDSKRKVSYGHRDGRVQTNVGSVRKTLRIKHRGQIAESRLCVKGECQQNIMGYESHLTIFYEADSRAGLQ